ncbi:hypothetical protein [Candidatus Cetobacterium colombiensis]|uniref:Lipoprotein n=1 Tax=Candidatus Cetobacterium colombiensis TaxID=3073100 RepID=A0ABU4WDD3_9FUSO|nr:hypothetical protein [Candidatus Cetobacterium colombiensis]MDX8336400.1 hypothetical protein [Candidatus Cetobacterium colombiensis]
MLKKIVSTFFIFLLVGCNNLSIPNPLETSENREKMSTSVDSENEVIGIGSAKIGSSGTLVANGKASREAKEKLKSKILSEEDIIFKSFLVPADPYTRKILSPALSDLMEYTANQLVQKSIEKDSWMENNKVYIVYSISKNEILQESQNIFTQYIDDITSKFQLIKEGVTQTE